jgi:hypothetical protein
MIAHDPLHRSGQAGRNKHGKAIWEADCSCGTKGHLVTGADLLKPEGTRSCGCLTRQRTSERRFKTLTGQRFTRLIVRRQKGRKRGHVVWECDCDCGATNVSVNASELQTGRESCGCLWKERFAEHCRKVGRIWGRVNTRSHGRSNDLIYRRWRAMLTRCTNENQKYYHVYGGAGVTVCDRWRMFEKFLADLGELPSKDHSLGRILDMGNYEPGNAFWMTKQEEVLAAQNKRALLAWAARQNEPALAQAA